MAEEPLNYTYIHTKMKTMHFPVPTKSALEYPITYSWVDKGVSQGHPPFNSHDKSHAARAKTKGAEQDPGHTQPLLIRVGKVKTHVHLNQRPKQCSQVIPNQTTQHECLKGKKSCCWFWRLCVMAMYLRSLTLLSLLLPGLLLLLLLSPHLLPVPLCIRSLSLSHSLSFPLSYFLFCSSSFSSLLTCFLYRCVSLLVMMYSAAMLPRMPATYSAVITIWKISGMWRPTSRPDT